MIFKFQDNRFRGEVPSLWSNIDVWPNVLVAKVTFTAAKFDFIQNNFEQIAGFNQKQWDKFTKNVVTEFNPNKKSKHDYLHYFNVPVFVSKKDVFRGGAVEGSIYNLDKSSLMFLLSDFYWKIDIPNHLILRDICIQLRKDKVEFLPFKGYILVYYEGEDPVFEYEGKQLKMSRLVPSDPYLYQNLEKVSQGIVEIKDK